MDPLSWMQQPDYFGQFGDLEDAVVMKQRGFGFVTYRDASSVDRLLSQRYHPVDGRYVEVKLAVPASHVDAPTADGITTHLADNHESHNIAAACGGAYQYGGGGGYVLGHAPMQMLPMPCAPVMHTPTMSPSTLAPPFPPSFGVDYGVPHSVVPYGVPHGVPIYTGLVPPASPAMPMSPVPTPVPASPGPEGYLSPNCHLMYNM